MYSSVNFEKFSVQNYNTSRMGCYRLPQNSERLRENIMQLPLANSPIIGLQYLAYPLVILLNYNECLPWFYSEYIQLVWNKNLQEHFTFYKKKVMDNFMEYPWLEYQILEKHALQVNNVNIHKFFTNSMNNGWYIISSFDEFYVPNRFAYQKNHTEHDFMIYGYDSETNEYFILGYSDRKIFEPTKIGFAQLRDAIFANMDSSIVPYKRIVLLRKDSNFKYEFDINHVYDLLTDYLYARNSSHRFRMFANPEKGKVFGMEVYSYLKKYFNLLANNEVDSDIRLLHILYEHKKCMLLRLKYMNEIGFLDDYEHIYNTYKEIENDILNARNIHLKFSVTNERRLIEIIIAIIDKVESTEKYILEIIISKIREKIRLHCEDEEA